MVVLDKNERTTVDHGVDAMLRRFGRWCGPLMRNEGPMIRWFNQWCGPLVLLVTVTALEKRWTGSVSGADH